MTVVAPRRMAAIGGLSRTATFALLTLVIPFVVLANRPLGGDVWWALAYGRVLSLTGQMPNADPFTFAPHSAGFLNAQWLSQVVFYAAYQLLDLQGVMVFNAVMCTIALAILLHAAWRYSRSLTAAACAMLLFALPAAWFIWPRAQSLALVPLMATVWLLLCGQSRVCTLLALGATEVVWANLHGSFFMGPLLTAIVLTGHALEALREGKLRELIRDGRTQFLLAAMLLQVAGSLATPFGLDLYRYAAGVSSHPTVRDRISEWQPTAIASLEGMQFFAAIGMVIAVMSRSRRQALPGDVLLLAVLAVLGLQAYRNTMLFGLICTPLMARYLADWRAPRVLIAAAAWLRRPDRGRMSQIRAGLLVLAVVMWLPWTRAMNPLLDARETELVESIYPQAGADFLVAHSYGPRVLADHYWSAYLDWRLWPRYQPMVDSAIDIHPPKVWEDFRAIHQANARWEEMVDRYDADVLMLSHENDRSLIDVAWHSPRWRLVYADPQGVIYVRAEEAQA